MSKREAEDVGEQTQLKAAKVQEDHFTPPNHIPSPPPAVTPPSTLPPPTKDSNSPPSAMPLPLTSPSPVASLEEVSKIDEILVAPEVNTNPPGTSGDMRYPENNTKEKVLINPNRGNYESHRGRSRKNKGKGNNDRGGKGGNKRGRKGRDEEDDKEGDEEVIGEGGAQEEDDVMDDEVARAPIKATVVDLEAIEAVRIPIDSAARKKKVAMLVGYNGSGFCGMQRNPGVRTIEDELEIAIYKAGGISKDNFRAMPKIDWMRCARTDKGVSALGNVVSFKVEMSPPSLDEMQNRINSFLDPAVRIFSMRRVNKKFNAKMAVNARSYEYVIPTFAFAPTTQTTFAENPVTATFASSKSAENEAPKFSPDFEFTEELRQRINQTLGLYVGTHRFHNFTLGKKPTEESAKRFIMSFSCGPAFENNGMQLVVFTVVGQSFMLHQIRNMVGMVLAIARKGYLKNDESMETVKKLFSAATSKGIFAVPMAPSLGLLLEKCIYSAWDKKFASNYGSLNFDEAEEERVKFKAGIYSYIVEKEKEENVMREWCTKVVDIYHKDFTSMLEYKGP